MGYNTPVLVMNDCLDAIRRDTDFGRRFADTIEQGAYLPGKRTDMCVGSFANYIQVLRPQHSNEHSLLHLHGNLLTRLPVRVRGRYDDPLELVRSAAAALGYTLVKA